MFQASSAAALPVGRERFCLDLRMGVVYATEEDGLAWLEYVGSTEE
jgi:hypothetical protein